VLTRSNSVLFHCADVLEAKKRLVSILPGTR